MTTDTWPLRLLRHMRIPVLYTHYKERRNLNDCVVVQCFEVDKVCLSVVADVSIALERKFHFKPFVDIVAQREPGR